MSNDRIPNSVLTERLANAEARIAQLESANRELQSALTVSRTFNKVAVHLVKKLEAQIAEMLAAIPPTIISTSANPVDRVRGLAAAYLINRDEVEKLKAVPLRTQRNELVDILKEIRQALPPGEGRLPDRVKRVVEEKNVYLEAGQIVQAELTQLEKILPAPNTATESLVDRANRMVDYACANYWQNSFRAGTESRDRQLVLLISDLVGGSQEIPLPERVKELKGRLDEAVKGRDLWHSRAVLAENKIRNIKMTI